MRSNPYERFKRFYSAIAEHDRKAAGYLAYAFETTIRVSRLPFQIDMRAETFVAALSLMLDTPYVCLCNKRGDPEAASVLLENPDERRELLSWFAGPEPTVERGRVQIRELKGDARRNSQLIYEAIVSDLVALEKQPDKACSATDKVKQRENLVVQAPVLASQLFTIEKLYRIPLSGESGLIGFVDVGRPGHSRGGVHRLEEDLWQALFPDAVEHGDHRESLALRLLNEFYAEVFAGPPGPRDRGRNSSDASVGDDLDRRYLHLLQQKATVDVDSGPEVLGAEIRRTFPTLDSFASQTEFEFAAILGQFGWAGIPGHSLHKSRWQSRDSSAHLTFVLIAGEPLLNAHQTAIDGFRESYWFSSRCASAVLDALGNYLPDGAARDTAAEHFAELWRHGFSLERSVIGYVHRTGIPLHLRGSARQDVRLYSYEATLEKIESHLFGADVSTILQIPVLFSRVSPAQSRPGLPNRYLASALAVLSSAPLEPDLRIALWDLACRLRTVCETSYTSQIEHWESNVQERRAAYAEQARTWAHELGHVAFRLGEPLVVGYAAFMDQLERMSETDKHRTMGILSADIFTAARDYIWIWAAPKATPNRLFAIEQMRQQDPREFLDSLCRKIKGASFAIAASHLSPSDPRSIEAGRQAYDRFVTFDVHTSLPSDFAPNDALFSPDIEGESPPIIFLCRAIAAALANVIKHIPASQVVDQPTQLSRMNSVRVQVLLDGNPLTLAIINPIFGPQLARNNDDGTEKALEMLVKRLRLGRTRVIFGRLDLVRNELPEAIRSKSGGAGSFVTGLSFIDWSPFTVRTP